jgi:hypothetical protein
MAYRFNPFTGKFDYYEPASASVSGVSSFNSRTGAVSLLSADVTSALGFTPEQSITAGTTAQYWRGDKSWQTLDKAAVGLGNISNALQLVAANNLSDLTNAATARTNLGLVIGTNVQAFNQNLADIAALADPNADRILFWDDSAGAYKLLTLGTNLSITGTTLDASGGGSAAWGAITGTLADQTDLQTALDAKQPLDSDLTAIAALTPTNDDIIQRKAGAWVNRTMAQLKTDLTLTKGDVGLGNVDNTSDVNKPISTATQTALNAKQALDATLTSLAAYNTNGLLTQTAADTFTGRTITGTSNQVNVANGNGVSGNPTLSLPQDIHTGANPTFNNITAANNIAFGGAAFDAWGGGNALQGTTGAIYFGSVGDLHFISNAYDPVSWKYMDNGLASELYLYNGTFAIRTAGSGSADGALSWSQKLLIANDGTATFAGSISASNLSGTNTGDQTIALTGDVTGSGTGSFATTIGANKVTLAMMSQMVTASFLGRNTALTGNVEVLSTATVKTMLNLTGTNSGDETATSVGTLINGTTAKTTPVDADNVSITDSAASHILKKVTWANIKATLKTYFDTLYLSNPMTTAGDIIIADTGGTPIRLAKGAARKVLQMNAGATAPEWGYGKDWDVYITKSTKQDVTNSGGVDDTELVFAVAANEVWYFELLLLYNGTNTTGDYQFSFNLPNAHGWYRYVGSDNTADAILASSGVRIAGTTFGAVGLGVDGSTTIPRVFFLEAMVAFGASGGNIQFNFGNAAAGAGRTSSTFAGSVLRARKMA